MYLFENSKGLDTVCPENARPGNMASLKPSGAFMLALIAFLIAAVIGAFVLMALKVIYFG